MAARLSPERHRQSILAIAESWIGTPYRHQASTKHVGCDCLGLVMGIWYEIGGYEIGKAPDYSRDWAECSRSDLLLGAAGRHLCPIETGSARPGDVLVFKWSEFTVSKHLAILALNNRIIHAFERHVVCKTTLVPQWGRRISGAFSFPQFTSPE